MRGRSGVQLQQLLYATVQQDLMSRKDRLHPDILYNGIAKTITVIRPAVRTAASEKPVVVSSVIDQLVVSKVDDISEYSMDSCYLSRLGLKCFSLISLI